MSVMSALSSVWPSEASKEDKMKYLVYFMRIALTIGFTVLLIQKAIDWSKNDTGTNMKVVKVKETKNFSLIICPISYNESHVQVDNEDLLIDDMPKVLDFFKIILVKVQRKEMQMLYYDLNNESSLLKNFNTSLESTWKEFITTIFGGVPIRCASVKLPVYNFNQFDNMFITIENKFIYGALVGIVENGKSTFFETMAFQNFASIPTTGGLKYYDLVHKREVFVKDCENNKKQLKFDCHLRLLESTLSCSLPWKAIENQPKCALGMMQNYTSMSQNLLDPDFSNECTSKECIYEYWKPEQMFDSTSVAMIKQATSGLGLNLSDSPHSTVVSMTVFSADIHVTEEYFLVNFTSFIADIGGFLGLLLGASILSVLEFIFELKIQHN